MSQNYCGLFHICVNERLSSHLLQRVEGVSIVERGWCSCLIVITLCLYAPCLTFLAHLTKWRCWWAGDSLFVTNPSPSPRLVCTRASEEGACMRKGTSTTDRTSILGAPNYWLWNLGSWNSFALKCWPPAPSGAPPLGLAYSRLSPKRCLFTTARFLSNWRQLCSTEFLKRSKNYSAVKKAAKGHTLYFFKADSWAQIVGPKNKYIIKNANIKLCYPNIKYVQNSLCAEKIQD